MATAKIFGVSLSRNFWLWIFWAVLAAAAYLFCTLDVDSGYLYQRAVKVVNLALGFLAMYMARKLELVKVPVQESFVEGLKNPDSQVFGWTLIAIAIYYHGVFTLISTVLNGAD